MVYKIDYKDVTKEQFELELQKRIDEYAPVRQTCPKKEDIRDILSRDRLFSFPEYDKRFTSKHRIKGWTTFIAAEPEIFEMEDIIVQNEFDPLDDDAFRIAAALYNAGYRRLTKTEVK